MKYNAAQSLCMLDNQGYKHTPRICNYYCFSTATVVTPTHLNVALYIHFLTYALIRNFYAGSTGLRNSRFFILISLPRSVLFSSRFVYELESLVY